MDTLLDSNRKEYLSDADIIAYRFDDSQHKIDLGINKSLIPVFFYEKAMTNNQNRNSDNLLVNSLRTNAEIFRNNRVSGVYSMRNKQTALTEDIIRRTKGLEEVEDLRDQIIICSDIVQKTLNLLKLMEKANLYGYEKNVVHLFFQAIKRNYAKKKFNQKQIELLVKIMKASMEMIVSEEEYLQYDEELYFNDLDTLAEVE